MCVMPRVFNSATLLPDKKGPRTSSSEITEVSADGGAREDRGGTGGGSMLASTS
eukprot:m.108926 g.108926  ORF g.108926 m.108926 type:complete len:54 (-) comp12829_c0_seq2:148-309(-)